MSLLALEGISVVRGGRLLVEGFGLVISAGQGVRLAGPNGVGKSSLLRVAAGLLAPVGGTQSGTAKVALADEGVALDRELRLGAALAWWGRGSALEKSTDIMGLGDLVAVPVRLLSTGQLRRARLARVIASGADLWLLDEPQNGLDSDGIQRLDRAIAEHRAGGGAVLAASHVPLFGDWRTIELGA